MLFPEVYVEMLELLSRGVKNIPTQRHYDIEEA
jgi:hypothetical protein